MEKLSNILSNEELNSLEDVTNYCLDNKITSIINDFCPKPMIEYSLSDLEIVW